MKIIILGLTNKTGLTVARNLNKYGCSVDAIYTKDIAAKHSKHVHKSFFFGFPEKDLAGFVKNLLDHLSSHKYDALIPIHDGALEICRNKYAEISSLVKIVGLNRDDIYKYSIDKYEMLQLGKANGLLIPNGYFIDSLEAFKKLTISEQEFPLVAKPVSSANIYNNRLHDYSVKICHNYEELTNFIRENINTVNVLIQEFVKGYGIGYDFIAKDGKIQNAYIHRRINENSGVSTLRESLTTEHYNLKEKVTQTVKAMKWSGVGMVEFMIKPDGTPILMEFNGRFFGSTEVSVKSGINLPVLFLRQFVQEENIEENIPVKNVSVRCLHDELMYYTVFLLKRNFKGYFKWLGNLIVSLFKPNHYFEITIFSDFNISLAFYRYDLKRWKDKWKKKKEIKNVQINPLKKEDLKNVQHVTFFCLGNICRSPFAEYLAKKINGNYNFHSLGSFSKEQRLSPINGVKAAKKFEIDLNTHLSKCISTADIKQTDLFVVMDKANYINLINAGVNKKNIRFLAGEEVKDPYGKSVAEFEKIYKQIEDKIEEHFAK